MFCITTSLYQVRHTYKIIKVLDQEFLFSQDDAYHGLFENDMLGDSSINEDCQQNFQVVNSQLHVSKKLLVLNR